MSSKIIEIEIRGPVLSGKTELLHGIGLFLKKKGFNVKCVDDIGGVEPTGFFRGDFDSREISVFTVLTE